MVAAGEPGPAHVQLAHRPGGNGPQALVEDGGGQAVHHLTDRDRPGLGTVQAIPGDIDRRLGRAVQVEHRASKHLSSDRRRLQRLASRHESEPGRQAVLRQRLQHRRDEQGPADVVAAHVVTEPGTRDA